MACNTSLPDTSAYLGCVGVQPRYTEAQVSTYADRAGASGAPWIRPLAIAFLRVNRVIYWKNTPNGLVGDCGTLQTQGISGAQIGGIGISAGTQVASVALKGVQAVPIIGSIVGFADAIFGIFGGAHAAAVRTEQATLCDVAIQYDQFADAIEQGIASGQVPLQDALAKLNSVLSSLDSGLASIEKPYNAPYGYRRAIKALGLFNTEVVYPSLVPGIASKALGAIESPSGVLAAGGAVLAAKVFGII